VLIYGRLAVALSYLSQRLGELSEELERLVPIQSRSTRRQHRDRPAPVLDELGDRHGQRLTVSAAP